MYTSRTRFALLKMRNWRLNAPQRGALRYRYGQQRAAVGRYQRGGTGTGIVEAQVRMVQAQVQLGYRCNIGAGTAAGWERVESGSLVPLHGLPQTGRPRTCRIFERWS